MTLLNLCLTHSLKLNFFARINFRDLLISNISPDQTFANLVKNREIAKVSFFQVSKLKINLHCFHYRYHYHRNQMVKENNLLIFIAKLAPNFANESFPVLFNFVKTNYTTFPPGKESLIFNFVTLNYLAHPVYLVQAKSLHNTKKMKTRLNNKDLKLFQMTSMIL